MMSDSISEMEPAPVGGSEQRADRLRASEAAIRLFIILECERRWSRSVQLTIREICDGVRLARANTVRDAVKGLVERRLLAVVPRGSSAYGSEGNEYVPLEGLSHRVPEDTVSASPGGRETSLHRGTKIDLPKGLEKDLAEGAKCPPKIDDGSNDDVDRSYVKRIAEEVVAIYAVAGAAMPPEGALQVARVAIEHDGVDVLRFKAVDCAEQARTAKQRWPGKYLLKAFANTLADPSVRSPSGVPEDKLEHLSEAEEAMHAFAAATETQATESQG